MSEIDLSKSLISAFGKTKVKFNFGGAIAEVAHDDPLMFDVNRVRLTFRNVRAIPVAVNYSAIKEPALPDNIIKRTYIDANCNDRKKNINDTLSFTYTEGASVSRLVSVTEGRSVTLASNAGLQVQVLNAGLNVTKAINVSFLNQETKGESYQKGETENISIRHETSPNSIYVVKIEKKQSTGYVDFDGVVKLDGDIYVTVYNTKTGQLSGRYVHAGKISDYLSSDRATIHLKGQLWNVSSSRTIRIDDEVPTSEHPELCEDTLDDLSNIDGQELLASVICEDNFAPRTASSVKVVEQLVSGKTITTANVAANIEVRAKSLGPGFCATTIRSEVGSAQILAPPLHYSEWTSISFHLGSVTNTLNIQTNGCQVLAEVSYFKKL